MNDIEVLVRYSSNLNELAIAANNIIINYDLYFSTEDILKAFENLKNTVSYHSTVVMHLALTTNLRMFIAIIYALLDNKIQQSYWCDNLIRSHWGGGLDIQYFNLGNGQLDNVESTSKIYCALYDYYEFNITDLALTDEVHEKIRQHIDSKQPYTKRATK